MVQGGLKEMGLGLSKLLDFAIGIKHFRLVVRLNEGPNVDLGELVEPWISIKGLKRACPISPNLKLTE